MLATLPFKTPDERLAFQLETTADLSKINYGDCWRIPLAAGLFSDRYQSSRDTAMLLLIELEKLALEEGQHYGALRREDIVKSPTFQKYFNQMRTEADLDFEAGLRPGNDELETFQKKHPRRDPKELLATIRDETLEIINDRESDPIPRHKHVEILSPRETALLAEKLTGERIRMTKTKRFLQNEDRELDIPPFGEKTKGDVIEVTECFIVVDWDDERSFDLIHGLDEYEVVNSQKPAKVA